MKRFIHRCFIVFQLSSDELFNINKDVVGVGFWEQTSQTWLHWPLNGKAAWALAVHLDILHAGASSGSGWGEDIVLQKKVEVQAWKGSSHQGSSQEGHGGPNETGTGCCKGMVHPSGREQEVRQQE